jgi:hypothetical protein
MLTGVLLGLVGLASAFSVVRSPVRWAHAVIWILVLQNAVVIAAWKITGSDDFARNLLYAKEVVIAGGSVVAIAVAAQEARARRLPPVLWLVVAFGVLCALWIPVSYVRHEGLEQIARGLRSLVFPVLLLAAGALLVRARGAALGLRATLWWTAILLGVTAVVERNLVPLSFWLSIGLNHYWIAVRGQSAAMLNGGLPWNFYLPLFGSVVRRAFGIMTDPLDLSYYLLLPLGLATAEIARARIEEHRWSWLAMAAAVASALGIAFTLSRVPIVIGLFLAVAGPAAVYSRENERRLVGLAAGFVAAFGVILLISAATSPAISAADVGATAPIDLGSEGSHLSTLLRIENVRPLLVGQGLGTAGYLSSKFQTATTIGYEDPFLDAAAQIGLLGGLLLLAVVVVATVTLLRVRGPARVLAVPTGLTLGALGVGGILAGQLEVITSLGATWLFVGVMLAEPLPQEAAATGDAVPDRPATAVPAHTRG